MLSFYSQSNLRHSAGMFAFLLVSLPFFIFGCSSGGGSGSDSQASDNSEADTDETSLPPPSNAALLRISTFNAGLLPYFVPYTDERVTPVAGALATHEADVLCLQEVWRDGDRQTITSRLQGAYPSIYAPAARQKYASHGAVCSASDLEPVGNCILNNCLSGSLGFTECLMSSCHDEVFALADQNPECAEALTAQAGKSAFDLIDIEQELFGDSPAGLFAFGGSPGIVLAAKYPLENVQLVDYFDHSTSSRRVGVLATVSKNGVQHKVGCTHLQSNLDGLIPYTGNAGSWGEEQLLQANQFRQFADAYAGSSPLYLAGDFNCSRGNAGLSVASELEQTCRIFTEDGYRDWAAEALSCSFCSTNLLNQAQSSLLETRDVLLDHVFTKHLLYSGTQAERVFQDVISLNGTSAQYSDHYGVRLTVPVP